MLAAADDDEATGSGLDEAIARSEGERKPSLDDLLGRQPKKPEWPS
jgi:hypothetical protein